LPPFLRASFSRFTQGASAATHIHRARWKCGVPSVVNSNEKP
jgi:hypothetical protein